MGYRDAQNDLGQDIDLTSTGVSGNILDMALAAPNKGEGEPVWAEFIITTAGVGTGTVVFTVQDCDTVGGSYRAIASSRAYVGTELTKGKIIKVPLPAKNRQFVQGGHTTVAIVSAGVADSYLQG
jgi:hypothetical protein